MGKYANHKCHKCQIIRPAFNMMQKEISYKRGKSGLSVSFNPFANPEGKRGRFLKSVRVHSGRSYTALRKVWVCNDEKACDDVDYYKKLEEKKKNEKAKKYADKLIGKYTEFWVNDSDLTEKKIMEKINKTEVDKFSKDKERVAYLKYLWKNDNLAKIKKSSQLYKYLKYNEEEIGIGGKIESIEPAGMLYDYTHAFSYLFNEDFKNFNKFIKKFPFIGIFSSPEKDILKIFNDYPKIRDNFKSLNERNLLLFSNFQKVVVTLLIAFLEKYQQNETDPLNQKSIINYRNHYIKSKQCFNDKDLVEKYGSVFLNQNELNNFFKLLPGLITNKKEKTSKDKLKNISKNKLLNKIFSKSNSFDIINALLSEVVMVADKKKNRKELKFIENRFKLTSEDQKTISSLFSSVTNKKLKQIFNDIADFYDYDLNILQGLIENMFFVGSLDGLLDKDEIEIIRLVSKEFGINQNSFKKIKSNYISQ